MRPARGDAELRGVMNGFNFSGLKSWSTSLWQPKRCYVSVGSVHKGSVVEGLGSSCPLPGRQHYCSAWLQ